MHVSVGGANIVCKLAGRSLMISSYQQCYSAVFRDAVALVASERSMAVFAVLPVHPQVYGASCVRLCDLLAVDCCCVTRLLSLMPLHKKVLTLLLLLLLLPCPAAGCVKLADGHNFRNPQPLAGRDLMLAA
jgi:hypothetical protein